MTKIKCIEKYPMVGGSIKAGAILTEKPSDIGKTKYEDEDGNVYVFDNSEIIFSPTFQKSFIKCN